VLSPHVFLQGMLFKAEAFKSPNITSPERLYSLKVLNGLNEQKLPLKEELDEEFIFCQAVREAAGVRIARELQATTDWMRYRCLSVFLHRPCPPSWPTHLWHMACGAWHVKQHENGTNFPALPSPGRIPVANPIHSC
jgi:hypothetical protein